MLKLTQPISALTILSIFGILTPFKCEAQAVSDLSPPCEIAKIFTPENIKKYDAIFSGDVIESKTIYISEDNAIELKDGPATGIRRTVETQTLSVSDFIYPKTVTAKNIRTLIFDHCYEGKLCNANQNGEKYSQIPTHKIYGNTLEHYIFFVKNYGFMKNTIDDNIRKTFDLEELKPIYATSYCEIAPDTEEVRSIIAKSIIK
jgi:hypothetical protein